jgi:hypothetical protein
LARSPSISHKDPLAQRSNYTIETIGMTQTAAHSSSFRFSLRTMFILVTLAALASWFVVSGLPLWKTYQERTSIEAAAKQLKAGTSLFQASDALFAAARKTMWYKIADADGAEESASSVHFATDHDAYIAFLRFRPRQIDAEHAPCTSIEIFRLPLAPAKYQPQTARGRAAAKQPSGYSPDQRLNVFISDFLEFLLSDRTNNPGFTYEIIQADPTHGAAVSNQTGRPSP